MWFPDLGRGSILFYQKAIVMRRFQCPHCANEVHFSNTQCIRCTVLLGYSPVSDDLRAFGKEPSTHQSATFSPCGNRDLIGCNWLCSGPQDDLCLSCRHTIKIPDTADDTARARWSKLERAKRRLLYAIQKFLLPLELDPDGETGSLHFDFLKDQIGLDGKTERVMTGHYQGKITINLEEADDAIREKTRAAMGEPFRTLIGHFRHEVGHYYWDRLIAGQPVADAFRAVFGDERQDYGEALKAYYEHGPRPDWKEYHVSTYASAHPWEDFAETWAHYFHMVGGLETAYSYGIDPQPLDPEAPVMVQLQDPYHVEDGKVLIDHWIPLTVAMNAMNRAVGQQDFYPFALTPAIQEKLIFIHNLIAASEVQRAF
jgi:hypothetical protein